MERMPLMGFAHQKRSGTRPDEDGALRSNAFHAFSLAVSAAIKRKCPFFQNEAVAKWKLLQLLFYVQDSVDPASKQGVLCG